MKNISEPKYFQNNYSLLNKETTFLDNPIAPIFSNAESKYLLDKYTQSERKRHRICFHQDTAVKLHDIIICYDKTSYIPPNKHIGKAECLCILKGKVELFFFNDDGICTDSLILCANSDDHYKISRIPPNTWHGLRVLSDEPVVMKETILGPYDKNSLEWAEFAPSEEENKINQSGFNFYIELDKKNRKGNRSKSAYIEVSSNVLITKSQFPAVDQKLIDLIIERGLQSPLKRARLCLHPNGDDSLQDMLIYLAPGCNIPASYHINKDESLVVLQGSGKYEFLNQDGSSRSFIHLKSFKNMDVLDCCSFARINRFQLHKIHVGDEGLLIYETTSGPFRKDDTVYASQWNV